MDVRVNVKSSPTESNTPSEKRPQPSQPLQRIQKPLHTTGITQRRRASTTHRHIQPRRQRGPPRLTVATPTPSTGSGITTATTSTTPSPTPPPRTSPRVTVRLSGWIRVRRTTMPILAPQHHPLLSPAPTSDDHHPTTIPGSRMRT